MQLIKSLFSRNIDVPEEPEVIAPKSIGIKDLNVAALSDDYINSYDLIARQEMDWIIKKMCFLDVVESGAVDGGKFAYVKLSNGMVFYSFPTAEWQKELFFSRRSEFPDRLKEEAVNVAFDIVTRFIRENVGAHIPPLTAHLSLLRPDCQLVDVGAYIGYGAMRAATISESGGNILCIEAEAESCEIMQRNIEENGLKHRIKVIKAALGDEDGEITLHTEMSEGNRQGNIMLEAMQDEVSGFDYDFSGYKPVPVPLKKFDTIVQEDDWIDIERPYLTHLGINGAELRALRGMYGSLQRSPKFGVKVSTRYFDPSTGPIHDGVVELLSSIDGTHVIDIKPHVYAYRWGR